MNRQILKNILFNGISFITNMALTLLLTPYLVKNLGVVGYGFIPLAMVFTAYIGIITESLTIAINRNLTKVLQEKNWHGVREIFSTAMVIIAILIGMIACLLYYPVNNLALVLSIPPELNAEVKNLFVLLILAFSISLVSAMFCVSMYANNRVDLIQLNNIIRNISRVILVVLLFNYYEISLISFGYAALMSSVISCIYSYCIKRSLAPNMNFSFLAFNRKKVKDIMSIGGWLLINQLGFVLFLKVDLFIINHYLGAEESGLYSIAVQFNDVLRIFAGVISGVLGPAVIILYAQGKTDKMITMTQGFVKFLSLSISIPIIIICIWSNDILTYWIGSDYTKLSSLVWLLTLPLIINIGVQPLFSLQVALNKIKIPALFNVLLGAFGVIISIILINKTHLGYYSVAITGAIVLTLKNALLTPIYTAAILRLKSYYFLLVHVKTIIFSLISLAILHMVKPWVIISNLYELFLVLGIASIALLALSILFYSKHERDSFLNFIKEKS